MQATIRLQLRFRSILWRCISSLCLAVVLLAQPASEITQAGATANGNPSILASQVLSVTGAPAASQYFGVTSRTVRGDFLKVFNHYGLQTIGYPLSDEQQENGLVVQYFERVRMERHPELTTKGYGVLMTRLGYTLSKQQQPFADAAFANLAQPSTMLVKTTNHTLSEPFLSFWETRGGLELFGYPISEPMNQDGMRVQWFERARFEYHPELANKGQAVQLSHLGRTAYEKSGIHTAPVTAAPAADDQHPVTVQANKVPSDQAEQLGLSEMESYIFKSVNEQRAAAGLGAVKLNRTLIDLARSRSNDMATRNYFSHTTPEGINFLAMLNSRGFSYRFAGEILARNNYSDEQAASVAMTSYLNSPPHKAIIMDGQYAIVGVGYAKSSQEAMHYFTVLFAQQ